MKFSEYGEKIFEGLTFPLKVQVHGSRLFTLLDAWEVLIHHILSLIAYLFWENRDFAFIIIAHFMMSANNGTRFGL